MELEPRVILQSALLEEGPSGPLRFLFPYVSYDQYKRDLVKGFDVVAVTMISVCLCYLIPYATYPRDEGGCPSVHSSEACWRYTAFLLIYAAGCTLLLPLAAVGAAGALGSHARALTNKGSTVRRSCILRARDLLGSSIGTIWSVANSTFIYTAVSQGAATGVGLWGGEGVNDDAADRRLFITDDEDDRDGGGGYIRRLSSRSKSARGMVFALLIGAAYLSAAVVSISGVAGARRAIRSNPAAATATGYDSNVTPRMRRPKAPEAYLAQLFSVLSDNWYYSVGYSANLAITYAWFSAIEAPDAGASGAAAWTVLGLGMARALVLCGGCALLALWALPFDPATDATPKKSQADARLRLLLFRSCCVVAVVAITALTTTFATVYLPAAVGLDRGGQLWVLLAFAGLGLLTLPSLDTALAAVDPPTKRNLFGREVPETTLGSVF